MKVILQTTVSCQHKTEKKKFPKGEMVNKEYNVIIETNSSGSRVIK